MRIFRTILIILIIATGLSRFALNLSGKALAASIDSASLMEKINQERVNRNIPALLTSPRLSVASAAKTDDMFTRGYFDHVDPDGHYVWPTIEAAGYKPYRLLGENLAIDFSTEDGIIRAWIDSPTHRDNMLRAEFADQGLNARYGDFQSRYTSLVTSLFGSLAIEVKPKIPPAPQPEAPPPSPPANPQPNPAPAPVPKPEAPQVENKTAPLEKAPSKGRNEPAVQLTPAGVSPSTAAGKLPEFEIVNPKNLNPEDANIYEAVRRVFMVLVILLFVTIFSDAFFRGKIKGLWKSDEFPVILLLLVTTLLTMTFY